MDLTKFREQYPELLILMKEKGYSAGYIQKFDRVARLILQLGSNDSIGSYEQISSYLEENGEYADGMCNEFKCKIGQLKAFVEDGVFLGNSGKQSGFLHYNSYDLLSTDLKTFIDNYIEEERKRGKFKESTINGIASNTAAFFFAYNKLGLQH